MIMFKTKKMWRAIYKGDLKRVTEFLDRGFSPDTMETWDTMETALELAIRLGQQEIVSLLVDRGASTSRSLHYTALHGYPKMSALLLSKGVNPNIEDSSQRTALFYAQRENHKEIEALLLPITRSVVPALIPQNCSEWKMLSPEKVAQVVVETEIGYRITDIFNFRARDRVRIVQNLETKAESMQTTAFDDIAEKAPLEEAVAALSRLGGQADPDSIGGRLKGKPGF